MPTDLSRIVRSLLSAKATVALLERRLFKELSRTRPNDAKASSTPRGRARRILKCPKCPRRFARPVHLGRHLSATHGQKRKKSA
jgi:uncharacterized C2H2 Zn-finger protein